MGLLTALPPGLATALWPPSGVALAALLLRGRGLWPGIWLGSTALNTLTLSTSHSVLFSLAVAVVIGGGSCLQALVGSCLITKTVRTEDLFVKTRATFIFCLVAALTCITAAAVGSVTLFTAGLITKSQLLQTALTWWTGDFVGILVLTSFIFFLLNRENWSFPRSKLIELGLYTCLLILTGGIIFEVFGDLEGPFAYLLVCFVAYGAFRFGQIGALISVALVAGMAIWAANQGQGPFFLADFHYTLLRSQGFVAVTTITGLLMAAVLSERTLVETALRASERKLKKTAEDLKRSNEGLQHFAHIASHDLQEPLRTVSNYVALIQKRSQQKLDTQDHEHMRFVIEAVRRMSQLISGLLNFAELGKRHLEHSDLNELLDKALCNLKARIDETATTVTYDKLPSAVVDPLQITQVFQNLISNAIKYRSESVPRIHIGCQNLPGEWVFSVKDNGIGVDKQYHEKILLIFQRLHGAQKYPGAGIGLALCKRTIEAHGGKIWLESEPGKGSEFFFSIPM